MVVNNVNSKIFVTEVKLKEIFILKETEVFICVNKYPRRNNTARDHVTSVHQTLNFTKKTFTTSQHFEVFI